MRLVAALLLVVALAPPARAELAVGSKNFGESRLLAEIFAQLLEDRLGEPVQRRLNLAGTTIAFEALRRGDIAVYPEYTGTGLVTLLDEPAGADASAVLARVRAEFSRRFDLVWGAPLGFGNSYELAVPRALAEREGVTTLSALLPLAPSLHAGLGYEFAEREDGLAGLRREHGLEFGRVSQLQQSLKYEAVGEGRIDVLDVYTTDGLILAHDLVVLEDDLAFFPPYQACPLWNGEALRARPVAGLALQELAGLLDEADMRALNRRVEVDGEPFEVVAASWLRSAGLVGGGGGVVEGHVRPANFAAYLWSERAPLGRRTVEHLLLVGLSLGLGILVAVPLGVLLERRRRHAEGVVRAVGLLQVIPSLALLAFMIPPLGVGATPAVVALFLYSLFPMVRASYTGVREASPAAVQSARALGMTPSQRLWQVRLPLAVPHILAGVRTAAVIAVGTATLAAFIGAGGLGEPIVSGLQLNDSWRILSGALPAALLALCVDGLLALAERALAPRGLG